MPIHLIKLCVGCDSVEALVDWQGGRKASGWHVHTRQTPKRKDELAGGGSLYRVFKGLILCRQRILSVDTVGEGRTQRCDIQLDPQIIRVAPAPRRAFQGWRYLSGEEAPPDLPFDMDGAELPNHLAVRLRELGAW